MLVFLTALLLGGSSVAEETNAGVIVFIAEVA